MNVREGMHVSMDDETPLRQEHGLSSRYYFRKVFEEVTAALWCLNWCLNDARRDPRRLSYSVDPY